MAGMNFQYDESGGTFYYFLVSFYALVLIPFSFWVFKKKDSKGSREKDKTVCHCEPCQSKSRRLLATKPREKLVQKVLYIVVILGWIFFVWAVYKVSLIQTDHVEYDPYAVLGVDRGATEKEIRRKYRELTRTHHPDKGGDEATFQRIAKAHAALTDEESRKNWEEYGNPDGPGAMQFGIALPKWLVEGNTSTWVLLAYILIFMVMLPAVVGTWWYKSIKYSGEKILLPTQQLYFYFINKTPNMIFKRALMILGSSLEFWKKHNPEVVERPTDDEEVRLLMRQVSASHLNEKNKEQPLCFPYSIKTRTLLLAHMQRISLPQNTLQLDLMYILEKCPLLINQMVQICAQLVAMAKAGQARKPRLTTIESIMKLSPLLVQGLTETSSPLLMLPHISDLQLKSFINKKRTIRNNKQFCAISDEERRGLLRHIEDHEYRNILNVLKSLPSVTMQCDMKVLDDEDVSITAGAIVTVLVKLTRESMFDKLGSSISAWSSDQVEDVGSPASVDEQPEGGDNEEENAANHVEEKKKTKAWEKNKSKKSKGGKKKKSTPAVPYKLKSKAAVATVSSAMEDQANDDDENSESEQAEKQTQVEVEGEGDKSENESESGDVAAEKENSEDNEQETANPSMEDDEDWSEFDMESKKAAKLEATSMVSHTVHCPYFPTEKQEYWWLYLCDKKASELITVPVRVTNLVDHEEIDIKFPAPRKTGTYTYTMCLKSDSYVDMDLYQNLKFDVKEAKIIENHPQWDLSDDEEKDDSDSNADSNREDSESDFEYLDD